ncbi:hypothetical protein BG003_001715, partial [Podila horticola]
MLDMMSSLVSAFVSVVVMNPMDVVRIRLYNRSSSAASQSTLQSCRHILVTEGPLAFYKGFSTHFMRIGPHFTLTFVFLGMLKRQIIEGSQPEVVESRKANATIIHGMEDGASSTTTSITSSVYKSSLDCLQKTFRHEGMRGLQKGLFPAILKESSKNIFRLGLYDPILNAMHPLSYPGEASTAPAWKRMIAGATCGAMGAISANPFELIKTRLQSHSTGGLAVGNQYAYTGTFSALRTIVTTDGAMTLYRGSMISIARSMLGSAANLTTYSLLKDHARNNWGAQDGIMLDMMSSL